MCKKIHNIITISIYILALITSFFFFCNFQIVVVHGNSMTPTLKPGQVLIAHKNLKNINYSDIVIFDLRYTEPKTQKEVTERIIKRVVALPGDKISAIDEKLTINSLTYDSYYFQNSPESFILKENEIFVLGDNASISSDSRVFGAISIDDIIAVYNLT